MWLRVRQVFIGLAVVYAFAGRLIGLEPPPRLGESWAVIAFIPMAPAIFLAGLWELNRRLDGGVAWSRPSWTAPLLVMEDPLPMIHFLAWAAGIQAAVGIGLAVCLGQRIFLLEYCALATCVTTAAAMHLACRLWPQRFVRREKP